MCLQYVCETGTIFYGKCILKMWTFRAGKLVFTGGVEGAFSTEILYKTNVPLNGQTRREISSPQPVDMPSAQPLIDSLMNPPDLAVEPPSSHGFNGSLSLLFSLLLFASVLVG